MPAFRRLVAALGIATAALAATAAPVAAECDPTFGGWRAFRDVAPAAPTIIIGEVTALLDMRPAAIGPGASPLETRFAVRVDRILRGTSSATLTITDAIPPGSQCVAPLRAGLGDRLAFALGDSTDPGPSVLAVAIIDRVLAEQYPVEPVLDLSEDEVVQIAELPVSRVPVLIVGGLVGAALLVPLLAARRRRRGHDEEA